MYTPVCLPIPSMYIDLENKILKVIGFQYFANDTPTKFLQEISVAVSFFKSLYLVLIVHGLLGLRFPPLHIL